MLAVSRKQAKVNRDKYYNTGISCMRGHVANRYTSDGSCIDCAMLRANSRYVQEKDDILVKAKKRYDSDPDKIKRRVSERLVNNPEKIKQAKRKDYQRNKQRYLQKATEWTKKNPEKSKQFVKNWFVNNPDKAYQYAVIRRMKLKQRLPAWLTESELEYMKDIYRTARRISQETGILHQVDHIIPLRGVRVSGLHVPSNLQILTAVDNRAKTNTF